MQMFPVNYSLVLHTAKLFHLKQFAIYSIRILVAYTALVKINIGNLTSSTNEVKLFD